MRTMKKGVYVRLNPNPCRFNPGKSKELLARHRLSAGKVYHIKRVVQCSGPCANRPWCIGRIKIGNMTKAECWGYSSKTEKWFGLVFADSKISLDEILGLPCT